MQPIGASACRWCNLRSIDAFLRGGRWVICTKAVTWGQSTYVFWYSAWTTRVDQIFGRYTTDILYFRIRILLNASSWTRGAPHFSRTKPSMKLYQNQYGYSIS